MKKSEKVTFFKKKIKMSEGTLRPCFDTTLDKYVFDLRDPLKTEKSTQDVCITENGLISANLDEEKSSSSDEDFTLKSKKK